MSEKEKIMINHQTMLDRLDRNQKLSLVTDLNSLSDYHVNRAGVPAVRAAALEDVNRERGLFPSYEEMAYSWDRSLVEEISEELAVPARAIGYNLLETPDLKCLTDTRLKGLSEDPALNAVLGSAIARGVHRAGAACAAARLAVSERDIALLDLSENDRAVYDLFLKPFLSVMREEPCEAVISSLQRTAGYYRCNPALFGAAAGGIRTWDAFAVSDAISPDVDYHTLLVKGVCLTGASVLLDRAMGRFEQLSDSLRAGSVSRRELQGAIDDGSAIDPAFVDNAADRTIEFAFRVNARQSRPRKESSIETLALRAAEESFVLLKNNRLLPLPQKTHLAVIGEGYDLFPEENAFFVDMRAKISGEETLPAIAREAASSEVILFFLRRETESRDPDIPVEQLRLAKKLRKTKRPMIAVITGPVPPDAGCFDFFDAVFLAPSQGKLCARALTELLLGNASPSGRLARTCYERPREYFRILNDDKQSGRTMVGPFVGYRYYDTASIGMPYPFGFGLTYTRFCYSGLRIAGDEVSFTVKNIGTMFGCEVVQVYLGGVSSDFPVPKKRLVAFERVELAPKEARRVTFTIPVDQYATYCERTLGESVKKGIHTVYVGASVSDIRLRGVRFLQGEQPQQSAVRRGDFFRDMSDLENFHAGDMRAMSRPKKNIALRAAAYILLFAALLTVVITGASIIADPVFSVAEIVVLSVMGALIIAACILLGVEKHHRQERLLIEQARRTPLIFSDAVKKADSVESIFGMDVSAAGEARPAAAETDEPKYFDRSRTLHTIGEDMTKFLSERGVVITRRETAELLAAFASTHLVILPDGDERAVNALCKGLSDYFGTVFYADNAEGDDLFVRQTESGRERTQLSKAMRDAREAMPYMHLALVRGVQPAHLSAFSFVRRAGRAGADLLEEKNDEASFPPNLWIVVLLKEQETDAVPLEIAAISSVLTLSPSLGSGAESKTPVSPIGYYQFANLCARVRDGFPLREQSWKRIDALEDRLGSEERPYRFGNRIWIKLEMYISVCLACGQSEADAIDSAIAAQLLMGIVPLLPEDKAAAIGLLEEEFGSEEIPRCRKLVEKTKMFNSLNNKRRGKENE